MERAGLKTLNTVTSPLHFRLKSSFFRPFFSPKVVHNLHSPLLSSSSRLSPLRSICIRSDAANGLPNGVGGAVAQNKLLQVVLVSPQPLGFPIDNTKLMRAGLDYWPYVVKVHRSWDEFCEYFRGQAGEKRLLAFTKRGTTTHSASLDAFSTHIVLSVFNLGKLLAK